MIVFFKGKLSASNGATHLFTSVRLRCAEIARDTSPIELDLMRNLKRTLDPRAIMNPGKVLPA